MKYFTLLLWIFAFSAISSAQEVVRLVIPPPPPLPFEDVLWGISQKETGGKFNKIGAQGERSEYQIKEIIWREHSSWPFYMASSNSPECLAEVRRVARQELRKIEQILRSRSEPVSNYNLAIHWTTGAYARKFSPQKREYAQCVVNLVQAYRR